MKDNKELIPEAAKTIHDDVVQDYEKQKLAEQANRPREAEQPGDTEQPKEPEAPQQTNQPERSNAGNTPNRDDDDDAR